MKESDRTLLERANENVGELANSPYYDAKRLQEFKQNTEDASDMTWEDLKRQAEGCQS